VETASDPVDRPYGVPYYVTDTGVAAGRSGWKQRRGTIEVLDFLRVAAATGGCAVSGTVGLSGGAEQACLL